MGGKKPKAQPLPLPDYSALEKQKERELEEADKARREKNSRRNNLVRRGKSLLSYNSKLG